MIGRYDGQAQLAVPQDDGTTRPMWTPRVSVQPATDVVYPGARGGPRRPASRVSPSATRPSGGSIADANPRANALDLERTGTPLAVPNA